MKPLVLLVLLAVLLSATWANAQPVLQSPPPTTQYPYYYQPPLYRPAVIYVPYYRPTLVGQLLFGPIWVPFPQPANAASAYQCR